jgi:hypothetical protein
MSRAPDQLDGPQKPPCSARECHHSHRQPLPPLSPPPPLPPNSLHLLILLILLPLPLLPLTSPPNPPKPPIIRPPRTRRVLPDSTRSFDSPRSRGRGEDVEVLDTGVGEHGEGALEELVDVVACR